MFEIVGITVSALCFLVGFVMVTLFIATKFEYFSKIIIDRANKNIVTYSDDAVFEAFIERLRDRRKKAKEKLNNKELER